MSKEEIYAQIRAFNKFVEDEKETKTKKYYYVQDEIAIDKANFVKFLMRDETLFKEKTFSNVIDLCYGSGNLTTHILNDADINYSTLHLNDKNRADRNNEIAIGEKLNLDFLDASSFSDSYDLIIFNPQIGGTDAGAVDFETTLEPILFDGSLEEYLVSLGRDISEITISTNTEENSLLIHSDDLSKSAMTKLFKDIKLFNYYDVFYQSKESKLEGSHTNVVKFHKTLSKISNDETFIVFLGEQKHFDLLFANYTYIREYLEPSGKQLFVMSKVENSKRCFEYIENEFVENEKCIIEKVVEENNVSMGELMDELNKISVDEGITGIFKRQSSEIPKESDTKKKIKFTNLSHANDNWKKFSYKNILFKGVPGTGKSRMVNSIIKNQLGLELNHENVLRINIHSASSNSDLMQGIGISSDDGKIHYGEKQGLILDLIKRATFSPSQAFVLVLEEIQENSLNELIGDLIYLIEDDKRASLEADEKEYDSYESLAEVIVKKGNVDYVEIPYLVSSETKYRKMIIPSNLFIFCTSNYRDDKKIIEDNLLRRFEVIEIYPKNSVVNEYVREFFQSLNESILNVMEDEIHPDRFMIGHAIFKDVATQKDFYRVLLKVLTEFKDIKEIDFDEFKKILQRVTYPPDVSMTDLSNYYELIQDLQTKIAYEFLVNND